MSFAFGSKTRERVVRSLSNLRRFEANENTPLTEGLVGLPDGYRHLTGRRYGALPSGYAEAGRLEDADYVVYCYGTPIAWVLHVEGDRGEYRMSYLPDWQYSPTTTYYQSLVFEAWGDCTDPDPRKSREDNRGTARGRSSDIRYGRVERPEVSRTAPSGPPAHLLDPRYSDPDWTPNPLSNESEQRDYERVQRDLNKSGYRPAHP